MTTPTDSYQPTHNWPGDQRTPEPASFQPGPEPWASTMDYPTQPLRYPLRRATRIRSTGTRIAIFVLVGFALLGIAGTVLAIVDSSRPHNPASAASTNGGPGATINTANPGTAATAPPQTAGATWSGDLAAFSSVIGSGPASGDAWNGAPCTGTTLGATGEQATALCNEPDGTRVFVTDFTSPTNVTGLMQSEVAAGGTATGWTFDGQHLGNMVTSDTNNTPTVAISFANDPNILVTMMNANTETLASDVNSAPLPH